MLQSLFFRLRSATRGQGWWLGPQVIMVVVLSALIGMWGVWSIYAAFNSVLVWLYADQHGSRKQRRQLAFKLLAIPLLSVGFLSAIVTGSGPTIGEKSSAGSPDERVRKAVARNSFRVGGWP